MDASGVGQGQVYGCGVVVEEVGSVVGAVELDKGNANAYIVSDQRTGNNSKQSDAGAHLSCYSGSARPSPWPPRRGAIQQLFPSRAAPAEHRSVRATGCALPRRWGDAHIFLRRIGGQALDDQSPGAAAAAGPPRLVVTRDGWRSSSYESSSWS